MQYPFILPKENSYYGLKSILGKISDSGEGSFLSVLKLYGKENENFLSFPLEGYSLALDFKVSSKVFSLLDELDKDVIKFGGRIYLSKDARMSKDIFEKGYSQLDRFKSIRSKFKLKNRISSLQSRRLGL